MNNEFTNSQVTHGSRPAPTSSWRRLLAVVFVAALAVGGGLVAVVSSSTGVSAQTTPTLLDAANCDTEGWIPTPSGAGGTAAVSRLRQECKTLVAARNAWVSNAATAGFNSHAIANWGTVPFSSWNGLTISDNAVTGLNLNGSSGATLGGSIHSGLCQMERLTVLSLSSNNLSGSIPSCLAGISNLRLIDLGGNQLSGGIPTGIAGLPNLEVLQVQSNDLTGNIPNVSGGFPAARWLNMAGNNLSGSLPTNVASTNLLVMNVNGNELTGTIPGAYTQLFTRMSLFDMSNNNLSGMAPMAWLNGASFVNVAQIPGFSVSGNRLCFDRRVSFTPSPNPLVAPTASETASADIWPLLAANSGRHANVFVHLENNVCSDSRFSSFSQVALPSVANVRTFLNVPTSGVFQGQRLIVSQFDPVAYPDTGGAPVVTGYRVLYREARDAAFNSNGRLKVNENFSGGGYLTSARTDDVDFGDEDPFVVVRESELLTTGVEITASELVVDIQPYYQVDSGGVGFLFLGGNNAWQAQGWRVVNVISNGTSAQEIARNVGLAPNREIFSWNSTAQRWVSHSTSGAPSGVLNEGTAVMFRGGVSTANNLGFAGVSRADENITLTMRQGWNLLGPANFDLVVGPNNRSVFFHSSLFACENLAGVLAVVTYDSELGEFKLALPCHPNVPLPAGYQALDAIDSRDSVYVFFRSSLPVAVTWNPTTSSYVPA